MIKLIYTPNSNSFVLRNHLGEGSLDGKEFSISSNLKGNVIMLEVDGYIYALDFDKFVHEALAMHEKETKKF